MENFANNDLEFSKQIAHNITAIKQLSLRCLSNCSEMERSFYTQQIKDIFLQILQRQCRYLQQAAAAGLQSFPQDFCPALRLRSVPPAHRQAVE